MAGGKADGRHQEGGGGASLKLCAACGKDLPRENYSNKQWVGKAHSRRCNACISSGIDAQGSASKDEASVTGKAATQEDDQLTALVKAMFFADPSISLNKATRQAAAKYKSLGMTPPSVDEVKDVWARIGLDKQDDDTLLKLWTIGVNPAAASDKEAPPDEEEEAKDDGVWFPVELDVPGERSGRMPYQALMNFNKSEGGQQRGRFGEMFKVQVAQGAPPNSPMLMYNKERTRKTFIHADAPGYEEIGAAVLSSGTRGALGASGGQKAFFHGRFDRKKDVVQLLVSELAEAQPW